MGSKELSGQFRAKLTLNLDGDAWRTVLGYALHSSAPKGRAFSSALASRHVGK